MAYKRDFTVAIPYYGEMIASGDSIELHFASLAQVKRLLSSNIVLELPRVAAFLNIAFLKWFSIFDQVLYFSSNILH